MARPNPYAGQVCATPGCPKEGRPRPTGNGDLSYVVLCDECARRVGAG